MLCNSSLLGGILSVVVDTTQSASVLLKAKLNEIGPLESVVEIPSQKHYYDGSLHLNVANVNC